MYYRADLTQVSISVQLRNAYMVSKVSKLLKKNFEFINVLKKEIINTMLIR